MRLRVVCFGFYSRELCSCCTTTFFADPLEYAKTQVQLGVFPHTRAVFRDAWLRGASTLYRGLQSNLTFAFPRTALRFSIYEALAKRFRADSGSSELTGAQIFVAGGVGGLAEGAIIVVPMTTLQVRLIADGNRPGGPQFRGLVHLTQEVLLTEGARGLFRGFGPTVAKISSNIAARFLLYDRLVTGLEARLLLPPTPPRPGDGAVEASPWLRDVLSLTAGGLAGAITVVANQPIDVVKSHLQVHGQGLWGASRATCRFMDRDCGERGLARRPPAPPAASHPLPCRPGPCSPGEAARWPARAGSSRRAAGRRSTAASSRASTASSQRRRSR